MVRKPSTFEQNFDPEASRGGAYHDGGHLKRRFIILVALALGTKTFMK